MHEFSNSQNISSLSPCTNKPNCVSSFDKRDGFFIEPIPLQPASLQSAVHNLQKVVQLMPRSKIILIDGNYIKATFTSLIFRFVDDVEFLITDSGIAMRSQSRLGYSDFGVNRRRMLKIRQAFINSQRAANQ